MVLCRFQDEYPVVMLYNKVIHVLIKNRIKAMMMHRKYILMYKDVSLVTTNRYNKDVTPIRLRWSGWCISLIIWYPLVPPLWAINLQKLFFNDAVTSLHWTCVNHLKRVFLNLTPIASCLSANSSLVWRPLYQGLGWSGALFMLRWLCKVTFEVQTLYNILVSKGIILLSMEGCKRIWSPVGILLFQQTTMQVVKLIINMHVDHRLLSNIKPLTIYC